MSYPASAPEQGTVKWYSAEKGYGFITPDAGGPDVFLHVREVEKAGLRDAPRDGDRLSFETVANPRNGKPAACNLRLPRA